MSGRKPRLGFVAVVLAVLALAAAAAATKTLLRAAASEDKKTAAASGPGKAGGGKALTVTGERPRMSEFADSFRAIGTAQARESIQLAAKVTDTIRALRFESGQRVKKGQVLVELANVEQKADLAEAEASLEVARRDYERFKELGERGFAPKAKVEQTNAVHQQALARVEALRARIADRTIRAPFDGVVGLRTASAGALVSPSDVIGTLDDVSVIKLDFDVPENKLAALRLKGKVSARAAAYPQRVFTGVIDAIDSRVDPQTRMVRVRALLPNGDRALKPGMLLDVDVLSNPRKAMAAPELAVVERGEGKFVFRAVEKNGALKVERAPVQTGARAGGLIEIVSGLGPDDVVIVEGVSRVKPGDSVIVKAPAAPSAEKTNAGAADAPAR